MSSTVLAVALLAATVVGAHLGRIAMRHCEWWTYRLIERIFRC